LVVVLRSLSCCGFMFVDGDSLDYLGSYSVSMGSDTSKVVADVLLRCKDINFQVEAIKV